MTLKPLGQARAVIVVDLQEGSTSAPTVQPLDGAVANVAIPSRRFSRPDLVAVLASADGVQRARRQVRGLMLGLDERAATAEMVAPALDGMR